jgi:hypothetical protein
VKNTTEICRKQYQSYILSSWIVEYGVIICTGCGGGHKSSGLAFLCSFSDRQTEFPCLYNVLTRLIGLSPLNVAGITSA